MLSVEQLVKDRIIVENNYPGSQFEVGEILYADEKGKYLICEDWGKWELNPEEYPHLFRKLEWYEERQESEMPHYVKVVKNANGFGLPENCIREVNEWDMGLKPPRADCFPMVINAGNLTPATEQEYNDFITKKEKK